MQSGAFCGGPSPANNLPGRPICMRALSVALITRVFYNGWRRVHNRVSQLFYKIVDGRRSGERECLSMSAHEQSPSTPSGEASPLLRIRQDLLPSTVDALSQRSVELSHADVVRKTQPGPVVVRFQSRKPAHPGVAADGTHVLHAYREDWIRFAYDLLRELEPVQPKDVPLLLRRIEEALDQNSERDK